MSKLIKITPEMFEEARKDFDDAIRKGKFSDGKISFTKTLNTINRKATIYFTELAWLKMQTLIREYDKEVAWHGVAERGCDSTKDEYFISDILVYPQEVTGATVTTDQEKYQTWLMSHDDEIFNNIRFQGHSHVNMGTSPSSVDTSFYESILEQLDDSMFYIFGIWNKKKDATIKIYDMAKNILFEQSDISVNILDDGTGIERFLKMAKEMVKDKVTTNIPAYSSGFSNSDFQGQYGFGKNFEYGSQYEQKNKTEVANNNPNKRKGKRRINTDKDNGLSRCETLAGWDVDFDNPFPHK